ncbi:MAG: hypothetical protein KAR20_16310, partial [Candidatus Heimdallarchaeota archaeon]|nr:hypothetical protein [Candidatus Heimdallarchaeota archaeon]
LVMAMNPIGIIVISIVAAIAVLTAAIMFFESNWENMKTSLLNNQFIQMIISAFDSVVKFFQVSWIAIATVFNIGIESISNTEAFKNIVNTIMAIWEPLKQFFIDLWSSIGSVFDSAISSIMNVIDAIKESVSGVLDIGSSIAGMLGLGTDEVVPQAPGIVQNGPQKPSSIVSAGEEIGSKIADFLGFGNQEENEQVLQPQMISPQERTARSIEESRTTSTSEVTIKDQTGNAEVTGGKLGKGLSLESSGSF